MSAAQWILEKPDEASVGKLQSLLGIHPVLCSILVNRGITDYDGAKNFFRPTLSQLHDPFLMKDMEKAVGRILKALDQAEKIMVFGDYDVDGTTSVAVIFSFLKENTVHHELISYYLPDRYAEGYGISTQGIDHAAANDISLIIALDCGIKSVDKIEYANARGIDFIICDHHLPGEVLPAAVAILNPKQLNCAYPYKELSGCGIGYKLISALALKLPEVIPNSQNQLLDLVATSIAADIVPMTGENRVLAYFGLQKANSNPCLGLKVLKEIAMVRRNMSITNLVFMLAPRINAAGRLGHASIAVGLFVATDEEEAWVFAKELNDLNIQRKDLDKATTEEAINQLLAGKGSKEKLSTVVHAPHWHKGVVGIVASRLIEQFHRPTIVLASRGATTSGSARSVPGFDIHAAIGACSQHLTQYGGHFFAAGLTLPTTNISAFSAAFEEEVAATILPESLHPCLLIDAQLSLQDINEKLYRILAQFEPCGPQNLAPVFVAEQVTDAGSRIVKDTHLQLHIRQGNSEVFKGIAFGMAEWHSKIKSGKPFDIAYKIVTNEYRGNATLELMVAAIRMSD